MSRLVLIFMFFVTACQADETLSAYSTVEGAYVLMSLDAEPLGSGTATLDVSQAGRVTGKGPCNSYSADQKAVYPWFELGPIISTRMACPDLPSEAFYFEALSEMTLAETQGNILILYNTDGREMVFHAP
ncbi:MAG: META domain-containing protein [Yoonia sp.]|nr:META domain-containing protein [Yoonia sp.]